ncbi:outer membrane receptor protein involved in Fe transport [Gillisia mitskevichiae]|uniref:Outer membrane receptor protein involved in Fe transport n=1 Tax=Gillisia mitskevichiae TaxID=270921 RepID=A0A495PX11_9FLAO|nr:outer membrane beta-barrel family protein [Gillisia mitskevichiae]RKS55358.1 outer membrane receptor protein involved in Fe transport [Gillisia mitskevichiae]
MKSNYSPAFLCLISLLSFTTYAQNSLKGVIIDENQNTVSFANVILLQANDSTTLYRGSVSEEDGGFLIDDIEDNSYILEIRFVGYENFVKKIEVKGNTNLRKLVLIESASNLDEVTVTAKKPTISRSVDRITFNVENSVLSSGNSYEILKRTPGVIVSQGQLLIKNRPADVYINDNKVYLTAQELQQLLEGFSGENVKSVEVITNPPAKYNAEGGSILNIITSKNLAVGYKGSLNASNTIAIKPKYSVGTSHYYKTDNLNAFASYNYNTRKDIKTDLGNITYFDPMGNVASIWDDEFNKETKRESHSLSTILDFTLSEKSKLSLSANILYTPKADSDIDGRTEIYNPQMQLDSLYTTDSRLENEGDNLLFNANYSTSIGENGSTFSAQANYIKYNDDQTQDLLTQYFSNSGNLLNNNSFYTVANQDTDIYTGQLDFTSTIAGLASEYGAKYSGIDSQSGLDFFDTNSESRQFVNSLSDEFNYNENIFAGYLSVAKDWDTWSIKAGLRGEYTDIEGNSASFGAVNTQEYFELFPTVYLMHTVGDNHSFGLDYSRRITRPRFQSLNPYRYFLNENNFQVGNPNLQPGISNKVLLNYTYKNKLSFDLYYDKINDAPAILPFQNNQNRTLRSVADNLIYEQQFSLDISYYDYVTDWYYLYIYSSIFKMKNEFIAFESENQKVNNEVTSVYLSASNYLTLSKDGTFSGNLTATYSPDFIAGSYDFDEPQYGVSLGLRKTFLNDRLSATVNVEDLFDTYNIPLRSNYLNQDNSFFAMPESRSIRFGLLYKFGNFKLRDNQRALEAVEKERLEAQQML